MGGGGKIVEVDETYIGRLDGQPKKGRLGTSTRTPFLRLSNAAVLRVASMWTAPHGGYRPDHPRQPEPRSQPDDRRTRRPTKRLASEFASHDAVNHGEDEYVRYWNEVTGELRADGKPVVETTVITTNTVEGYSQCFKRGMKGIYQHCAEKHLHRYLAEFDFRYSNRTALGVDDAERRTLPLRARLASA